MRGAFHCHSVSGWRRHLPQAWCQPHLRACISNEEARVEAENTRQETFIAAETNRNTNEVQRIASETERVNAENIRQEAEQERIDTFNQMKLSWLKYRIISETE